MPGEYRGALEESALGSLRGRRRGSLSSAMRTQRSPRAGETAGTGRRTSCHTPVTVIRRSGATGVISEAREPRKWFCSPSSLRPVVLAVFAL